MQDYSDLSFGWQGEVLAPRGYGVAARRMLKPLIEGGANVKLVPDEAYIAEDKKIQDPFWLEQIEKSKTKPDMPVHICYCIPPLFKPVKGSINILSSYWETSQYPREWIPTINSADIFWVASPNLVEPAKRAGVKIPIEVVAPTIDLKEWTPDGPSTTISEIPSNCIKFMFIGDWIPRKNYEDLIIGYMTAFDGCKDVALVIKTWSNLPGHEGRKNIEGTIRHFRDKLQGIDHPKIYLITDLVEESSLISFMRSMDAYISVSHGEGFDLPMVQAMSLGKLILGTNYLAHSDYMTNDNSLPIKYTMKPVYDAAAPLYHAYQNWSSPDMIDYQAKLRLAYSLIRTGRHTDIGLKARETVNKLFSPENNSPKIAEAIKESLKLKLPSS